MKRSLRTFKIRQCLTFVENSICEINVEINKLKFFFYIISVEWIVEAGFFHHLTGITPISIQIQRVFFLFGNEEAMHFWPLPNWRNPFSLQTQNHKSLCVFIPKIIHRWIPVYILYSIHQYGLYFAWSRYPLASMLSLNSFSPCHILPKQSGRIHQFSLQQMHSKFMPEFLVLWR